MFLLVNGPGKRHMLFSTLNEMIRAIKPSKNYACAILNPDDPGVFDLRFSYIEEAISGKRYIKGYIYYNPQNDYQIVDLYSETDFYKMIFQPIAPEHKIKYDISTDFPPAIVTKGCISVDLPLPTSILDDYGTLKKHLIDFFGRPKKDKKTEETPKTDTEETPKTETSKTET